jgi:hypothetical protein
VAKKDASSGSGCAAILGLALLILTLAWPLFVFHRHWTTSHLINCATNPNAVSANGCSFNDNTFNYTGTGIITTSHSSISATGWIVEIIWVGLLVGGVAILANTSIRKRRTEAVTKGVSFGSGKGAMTVRDVVNPELPTRDANPAKLLGKSEIVRSSELDTDSKIVLARAQKAISDVLTSRVYGDKQLERAVAEPTLRRHEWAIAADLREMTSLRREQAEARRMHTGSDMGPLTEAVISAQDDALNHKLKNIEEVVSAIERYASHAKAADHARADWDSAAEISKLNTKFTDLVAGTAADEIRLREAENMTAEARAFQDSITQANLAARSLFLPDTAADPAP